MNGSKITFLPYEKSIWAPPGIKIIELARMLNINIVSSCGGRGKCGKCKVLVEKGREGLNPPSESERKFLSPEEIKEGWRLACTISPQAETEIVIKVPEISLKDLKIQTRGADLSVEINPVIKKYVLELSSPLLGNNLSLEELLRRRLEEVYGLYGTRMGYEALKQLSMIWADLQPNELITLIIWDGKEILSVERGDTSDNLYGVAVDIGTTKVACFLMDLNEGRVLSVSSSSNPQGIFGEDVMSRVAFAMKGKNNLVRLQESVVECINRLLDDCCEKAGLSNEDIYDCCVVGNTCMLHLFLGISPKSLAFSPYWPVIRGGVNLKAGEFRPTLRINPNGMIYVMPSIAGFVGGDNVAVQLACNCFVPDKSVKLILDIGTNTEIVLADKKGIAVCSCASGPAFEGMHIKYGIRAVSGAIDMVSIDPKTKEVRYHTIGEGKPIGICGSGLIDAIAGLINAGLLNKNGTFNVIDNKINRLRIGSTDKWEFVIAWGNETNMGKDIVLTQEDIVEFQKAKAAIHAACKILMRKKNITENDIDRVIIAGAFGEYIDPSNAIITGLLPSVPLEKIETIGNAAGTGAKMVLLSRELRMEAEKLAKRVEYLELSADPEFAHEFVRSMFLK